MPQGFPDDVRDAFLRARDEAARLGHAALRPEHLLLALTRGGRGLVPRLLRALGVDSKWLRLTVEAALPPAEPSDEPGEPAPEIESVLEAAGDEAQRDEREVGPEHLLLALLREGGPAVEALRDELGLTYEAARAGLDRLLGREVAQPAKPPEPRPPGRRLTLVFDADADEQAVADFLAVLSALYRALGGDGLVILDSGVAAFDVEGERW